VSAVGRAMRGQPAVVGVDVGGTKIAAGLVAADGTVLRHLEAPTHGGGPRSAVPTLIALIERLAGPAAREAEHAVMGVGIGVPGAVDVARGRIRPGVHYVPELSARWLGPEVERRTGLPAFVDNDVNALALGEWMFGAGRGARSLVVLAIGTGVGGGIVLDGHLVRGAAGFAGELGHVPVKFDGRPCICGGRGCLKAYVSGTDIAEEGSRRLDRSVTAAEVFALASAGHAGAALVVDEACRALGAGLAMIVNGLNPEVLLITGSVARSFQRLQPAILARMREHAYGPALAASRIGFVVLEPGATVRGAAALYCYETGRRVRSLA
jgi:glucokinase